MVQWWDPAKIEATVTRQFVCQHLAASDVERLDRSLTFGGDLTDGTYWEWIDTKAKCIFLILVDLKMPSQIFGIIDNSWDDHDLPISQEQVDQLAQTPNRSGRVDRRFFQRQFHYLIKPLQRGDHIVFTNHEVVPLEVIDRRAGLASSHTIDKVVLPNCPGQVFCRRRIPLGNSLGSLTPVDFEEAVNSIRSIQNQHLVSCHASYTHSGAGYVLFTPATDTTLKSFLGNTPSIFKNQSKKDRRQLVMNWILCLVDTLAYIHGRGLSHGNIKLSTILFTSQLDIFYSDFTRLHAEALSGQADKSAFDRESYDYAAPEQWFRPTTGPTSPGGRKATLSMSVSPESHTSFSISRSDNPNNPNSMLQSPNPHLNPQAADIFSLGCVLLEMVSFILKKSTKSFATHRASKNKTAGRGGAVPDSSFHKNLGQVESWMTILAKEASKKTSESDGAAVLRGVVPMLHIIACMLSANPIDRPPADEIQHRVYQILTQNAGITEPHCVHRYGGWDLGFNHLRISSPTPGFEGGLMPHRQNTSASRSSRDSESFSGRRLGHSRTNSSGALSENSQASSSASSDRGGQETELGSSAGSMSVSVSGSGFAALRNIRVPQVRSPGKWQTSPTAGSPSMYTGQGGQASVY